MDGDLHRLYDKWSEMILNLSATVEASVDFSEDVGSIDEEEIKDRVKELVNSVELHMDDSNAGERLRDGVQVCILGKPNVGKSTLLNTLCRRPAAIVSPIAGTTRDTIEQYLDIGGFPIKIIDTAGIRDANEADTIELEGIKRAENVAKSSDLIIIVVDSSEIPTNAEIHEWCRKSEQNLTLKSDRTAMKILVLNKCDLLSNTDFEYTKERLVDIENIILMSCVTGKGFDQFINILRDSVQNLCLRDKGFQLSGACLTRPRHRYHLDRALQHLKNYLKDMEEESLPLEIQAHYLSNAFREFGLLTGKITLSTLHDKIFSDFCIGK
jgi:small GTP-binding protein